jgi:hypothetical protein
MTSLHDPSDAAEKNLTRNEYLEGKKAGFEAKRAIKRMAYELGGVDGG